MKEVSPAAEGLHCCIPAFIFHNYTTRCRISGFVHSPVLCKSRLVSSGLSVSCRNTLKSFRSKLRVSELKLRPESPKVISSRPDVKKSVKKQTQRIFSLNESVHKLFFVGEKLVSVRHVSSVSSAGLSTGISPGRFPGAPRRSPPLSRGALKLASAAGSRPIRGFVSSPFSPLIGRGR